MEIEHYNDKFARNNFLYKKFTFLQLFVKDLELVNLSEGPKARQLYNKKYFKFSFLLTQIYTCSTGLIKNVSNISFAFCSHILNLFVVFHSFNTSVQFQIVSLLHNHKKS